MVRFEHIVVLVSQALPRILNVAILLGAHTLLFGVLGFASFAGIEGDGKCSVDRNSGKHCSTYTDVCKDYFSTITDSFMQRACTLYGACVNADACCVVSWMWFRCAPNVLRCKTVP